MSTHQWTSGGWSPPGGATVDLYMGSWDPVTNTPTLADGDTFTDGMYWICSAEADRDLGSGSIFWSENDHVYRDGGIYTKRELAPAPELLVLTADGGLVITAQDHPVWVPE